MLWTSADLVAWRQRMGWSQVVAAAALETPLNTYTGWEQRRRHVNGLPGVVSVTCRLLEGQKMQEFELFGRIAELEEENAWLEEQMKSVYMFLREASESDTNLGFNAKMLHRELRSQRARRFDGKAKTR